MPETRLSSDQTAAKRLEQLRKQVYGYSSKSVVQRVSGSIGTDIQTNRNTDTLYLRQDLTKIAILSTLVLGIQLFLYYAVSHNLIRLTI